jgi:hypothetical protein
MEIQTSYHDRRKLLERLAELHQQCDPTEPWRIEREPHNYADGTTHFTHVVCTSQDSEGHPLKVAIGHYLTPDLAEMLVLMRNHLPDLITLARKGIEDG